MALWDIAVGLNHKLQFSILFQALLGKKKFVLIVNLLEVVLFFCSYLYPPCLISLHGT